MQNFVINLDSSVLRLQKVTEEFSSMGMKTTKVQAVDAGSIVEFVNKKHMFYDNYHILTMPEIACFLSHRKCWEIIVDSDDEYGSVFEDDIILSNASGLYLNNTDWINSKIDLIKLETFNDVTCMRRWGSKSALSRKLFRLGDFHTGSAGYIISKKHAKKILDLTNNYMPCPIDHFLFNPMWTTLRHDKIYQVVPAVCIQEDRMVNNNESSTIGVRSALVTDKKNKKTFFKKIMREFNRPFKKIYKFLFLRYFIVPFN